MRQIVRLTGFRRSGQKLSQRGKGRIFRHALALGLVGMLALAPAACGRKGEPVLPPPQTDQFPHQYPKTTDPQTGVFN